LDSPPRTRGPKAARVQDRIRGRSAAKAGFLRGNKQQGKSQSGQDAAGGSQEDESLSQGDNLPPSQAGEVAHLEGGAAVQGEDNQEEGDSVKKLKMEVQRLNAKCDLYEGQILDLQSKYDTHQRTLEMLQQHVVGILDSQGTLSTTYGGTSYEVIP
jgi:hypothetical protein